MLTIDKHKEVKIRNSDAQILNEVAGAIVYLSKVVGVKISPTTIEIDFMVGVIETGFSDFSISEIKYAFTLAHADKLGIDATHYQSFNSSRACFICCYDGSRNDVPCLAWGAYY